MPAEFTMSAQQAAKKLGVGMATVRRMCFDGRLGAIKVGVRTWVINPKSVSKDPCPHCGRKALLGQRKQD